MISQRVISVLLAGGLLLPIVIVVLVAVARLLEFMADQVAAGALQTASLVLGVLWIVVLICLVLAQAVNVVGRSDDGDEPRE